MKINQVLVESTQATVAFAFGRFNPAHQGHIAVWHTVEQAGKNWFVGTNPNTIGPNDPLTFQQKSAWMEEIYPPIAGHIVPQTSVLTLAAYIFKKLRNNESASIAYVTDDTDWAWSGKLLNQYNGVEGAHGYYKFAQIVHVPSPRVSSATALRDAARADDKVAFYHASGTDPKLKVAGLSYFDTVKQACEKYPLPVKKAKKVKEQTVAEANPNQQFALWHPETKTYKGTKNKIPTSDYAGDNDITTNYRKVDNFKHSEVNPLHKGDDSIEKAERNVNREQLAKLVKAAFNILTPEEKEVLNYRFWHDMTLDSIAQKMSISGPRVRQIEAQAFRKLKKSSNLTPVGESAEQKTVAKTWDQMTPQEKISGVKGRTVWNEKTRKYYTVFDVPAKQVKEDEEAGEVKKTGQLIPFPQGTTKVSVSDVYDWYKLGQVISDLDDADPSQFGQGAPETVIAFGSEEEENKLLPLLQRLGLKLKDIDQPVGEAYHAGSLYEMLKKERTKNWALVNKRK